MLARLEAHVAEQQRFAANASHELRTPLAITQTLLDVARSDPYRDTGQLLDRLHAVNTRAIDLTEALLLLSRADQRAFSRGARRPLAARRGRRRDAAAARRAARGRDHDVWRPRAHHRVGALLLQLTTNLLHNAVVHNLPAHGSGVPVDPRVGGDVVLTVENTGEPLPEQAVATLVEPFQRGTGRVRTHSSGTGLGLAIAQRITEAHDGTLTLSPRPGGGLRVVVELPAAPAG